MMKGEDVHIVRVRAGTFRRILRSNEHDRTIPKCANNYSTQAS